MFYRLIITSLLAAVSCCYLLIEDGSTAAKPLQKTFGDPLLRRAAKFAILESVSSLSAGSQRSPKTFEPTSVDLGRKDFGSEYRKSTVEQNIKTELGQFSAQLMPLPVLSFDGLANSDNVAAFGLIIAPPDMTGEAGPNHFIQIANTMFRVYNKTGQPLSNPISIKSLFQKLGTPCSNRNDGLPNVIYDQLADRWLISQVCSLYPPFRQMIAVSKSGDPLGSWFGYEFVMPNVKINDFPKMSLWPDGYYMTTNEILGSDYTGTGIFAFDRTRMLAGDPGAGFVYFSIPAASQFPAGALPSDLDGLRPPPDGTPAIIATHIATEYGQPNDAIRLFDFHPDFEHPEGSYLRERSESPITVAPFDPTSPEGRSDISQPPPGERMDSVSDTLMPRLAYRNFGTHQSLVVNQTVRLTPPNETYRAGVRVYELRNSGETYSPFVQSTIGDTTSSRWIGSAAQDNEGNLAVQYNFATDDKPVSILYSGRLAGDPPNSFRGERALIDGTGVQKGYGWRWGEYSSISVDPADDCTFWITNSYYTLTSEQFSDWGWLTRIGNFKFDECTPAPTASIAGVVTNAATGKPINDAAVSTNVYSRQSGISGSYGPMRMLPGQYQVRVIKHGFRDATRTVNVDNGDIHQQDFALEPIPVLTSDSHNVSAESCGIDRAIDPGETVTIDVAVQNTGAADITSLNAALLMGGGVTLPSAPQNFGPMPSKGTPVIRAFNFTANSAIKCGDPIVLTFALSDGPNAIGNFSFEMKTGRPKIVLKENFDRTMLGALPPRWTRQAFAASGSPDVQRNWRLSMTRFTSGTKGLFSPSLHQAGINEIVSPIFRIGSNESVLTFQNWYELETTFLRNRLYDGSVLEIRIGDSAWQDIVAAGGAFTSGGYDGAIDACCQNPLAGRQGWSGWSGIDRPAQFVTTSVKLPANAAGQKVQLRWRVGTDLGTFREGQYIDDVTVTDGTVCSCN